MGIYEGIRVMEDEHRSLAAVLHALEFLANSTLSDCPQAI